MASLAAPAAPLARIPAAPTRIAKAPAEKPVAPTGAPGPARSGAAKTGRPTPTISTSSSGGNRRVASSKRASAYVPDFEPPPISVQLHLPQIRLAIEREEEGKEVAHRWGFSIVRDEGGCFCLIHNEMRVILLFLSVVGVILVGALLIAKYGLNKLDMDDIQANMYNEGVTIAGIFAGMACFLSAVHIQQHQRHFLHAASQRHLLWVLGMVPVYSAASFLGLVALKTGGDWSMYIDFVRVVYEALVIYQFFILLTKYLGGSDGVIAFLHRKAPAEFPWPLNKCFAARVCNADLLRFMKRGALQYACVAPLTALFAMMFRQMGLYEDGDLAPHNAYFWCSLSINFSQLWALYCLVWFFQLMSAELAPFKPMVKFLVVKLVVFFTFWQGIALAIGVKYSLISDNRADNMSVGQVQVAISNTLITIEMFIAAIAHKYAFPWEVYADGSLQELMTQRASEATAELSALGYGAHMDDELAPPSKQQKQQHQQPLDTTAVLGEPSDATVSPLPPKLDRQLSALGDAPPPPGSVMYQLAASPRAELHDMVELRAAHELRKSQSGYEAAGSDDDASTGPLRNFKRQAVSAAAAADVIASTSVAVAHAHHRPSVFTFQGSKHSATKPATVTTVPVSADASVPENDELHHDQDMESVIRDELRRLGQK